MAKKRFTAEQIIGDLREERCFWPRAKRGGRVQVDRSDGADLLPVAQRVRRAADGPGQTVEGLREGEYEEAQFRVVKSLNELIA